MTTEAEKEEIKAKIRSVMKHFRLALKEAEQHGTPMLLLAGQKPDGSGQRVMSLPVGEFFADLAILVDAEPDSMEDEMRAKAAHFMQKHGLTVERGD